MAKTIFHQEQENWARVPKDKRFECVTHLRETIPESHMSQLREMFEKGEFPLGFHMFGGMAIRNTLRDVMKDSELPPVEYPGGAKHQNWDDFYMAALREACGA